MSVVFSSRLEINCSVPQGRIAGAVLFFLYMSDVVIQKLTNYADDTSLLFDTQSLDQSIANLKCDLETV